MNLFRERRKIERHIREGLNNLGSNDYASAWRSFEQVLLFDEDNALANTLGAASLLNIGRLDEAEPLASRGVRLTPHLALAHYYLALILIAKEKYDEAESEIWEAVAIEPYDAGARLVLGRLLFILGREDEAREHLERCVEIIPDNPEAHFLLGLSLMRRGQLWKAKEELDKTLSLQPDNDGALTLDGLLWMAKADDLLTTPPKLAGYRHAATLLRRAIELNPSNELAVEWLRLADETIKRISRASEPPPPPEKWYKTHSKQLLVFLGLATFCIALNGVLLWFDPSHHRTEDFRVGSIIVLVIYLLAFFTMSYLRKGFSALPPTIANFAERVSKGDVGVETHSKRPS